MAPDPSVAYEDVASVLNFYAQAMCGRAVRADLIDSGPVCDVVRISDDEIRIRVPESVHPFPTRAENARYLRCLVSHQVAHAEFGTDRFRLDRPSRHFRDWRPRLSQRHPGLDGGATVLQLLGRLHEPALARAVFFELEELRVEAALQREYPGVAADLRWFDERREEEPGQVGPRWLRQLGHAPWRADADPAVARLRELTGRVRRAGATVEDASEATLRAYALVRRLGSAGVSAVEEEVESEAAANRRPDAERRRTGAPDPLASAAGADEEPDGHDDAESGGGDRIERGVVRPTTAAGRPFTYPEWDFRTGSELRAHTTVWEHPAVAGSSAPYHAALREYAWLVRATRSRFEAIAAAAAHDRMRDVDGDSLDLDALIDNAVSRRAHDGHASEYVYSRRGALRRDVAAAILLDISATTGEPILHRPSGPDPTTPAPDRHTILSVELAASIVMMRTADDLGDQVAFYAFSGLGRHGVDVATVKEFTEALDHRVASRVGGLRPQRATRMGAAIRHATARLHEQPANRRLLFFVNDGRPFDIDYGRDDDDQQYAIADTRRALDEAVDAGISPICLTVQATDPAYLSEMCGRVPYESIRYAEELPERLLAAYARLRS